MFDFVIRIPLLLCDQLNSEWHCCPCFVIQVRLATISGLLSLPLLFSSLYTCNHQPLPTIPPGQPPSDHQASRTPVNNNISFYRSSFNIFLIRSIIKCGCFYTCPTKLSTARSSAAAPAMPFTVLFLPVVVRQTIQLPESIKNFMKLKAETKFKCSFTHCFHFNFHPLSLPLLLIPSHHPPVLDHGHEQRVFNSLIKRTVI